MRAAFYINNFVSIIYEILSLKNCSKISEIMQ